MPTSFAALLQACIAVHLAGAFAASSPVRDGRSCDAYIVSATVMASVCTHAAGERTMLDLLVLWRGAAGWFRRSESVRQPKEVVRDFARGETGRVAQFRTYADVTVGFDADFDAHAVTIDGTVLPLTEHNTIVVDDVDVRHLRRIARTFRVDPVLPTRGDVSLALARRSADIRDALQCDVQMPSSSPGPGPLALRQSRPPTVCELLRQ